MDQTQQDKKEFLVQQLQWCEEQNCILEEMDVKLHKMKRIAEYSLENELTSVEIDKLNDQLNELKSEVHYLEKQLHSVVH